MTMPDRIRESVQAAVEEPVDVHDLLRGTLARAQRSRFAPVLAAAAAVAVVAAAGVLVQDREEEQPTPAEPSAPVVPFAGAEPTEGDVPPPNLPGAPSGSTAGCNVEIVKARIIWTVDSAITGDLRGQVRISLAEAAVGGCSLGLEDPRLVLLGPADGPVGPSSSFVGQQPALLPPSSPKRYVSPGRDVIVPLALTGSNCVPSTFGSIVGMTPSLIGVNFDGDRLPCDTSQPPRDGTLTVGLPRTEGTPAALVPPDRQNLRVSLELPDNLDTRGPLGYLVRLANPTDSPISLQPCPAYQVVYGVENVQGAMGQVSAVGRLNCDAAPDVVPAGEEIAFEMMQQPFSGGPEGSISGVSVHWGIAGPPASPVARVRSARATATPSPTDVEQAAVRPGSPVRHQALAFGVLRADSDTGCLWLEGPDGNASAQLLLQGESYSVDFDTSPAVVMDGNLIVARVGDHVRVGGGSTDKSAPVPGCPVTAPTFLGYFE